MEIKKEKKKKRRKKKEKGAKENRNYLFTLLSLYKNALYFIKRIVLIVEKYIHRLFYHLNVP
jgi:hypothetical protein